MNYVLQRLSLSIKEYTLGDFDKRDSIFMDKMYDKNDTSKLQFLEASRIMNNSQFIFNIFVIIDSLT